MGDIHHGITRYEATHLSVGDREWTTVSNCTPHVPIKGSFKLKRREGKMSLEASSQQASRRQIGDGF